MTPGDRRYSESIRDRITLHTGDLLDEGQIFVGARRQAQQLELERAQREADHETDRRFRDPQAVADVAGNHAEQQDRTRAERDDRVELSHADRALRSQWRYRIR